MCKVCIEGQCLVVQAEVAAATSLACSFLTGIVSVSEEILQQVAPVLLVRLLHHLNPDTMAAVSTVPGASVAPQPLPQVSLLCFA